MNFCDWQPLESAPRDGTVIRIWTREGVDYRAEWKTYPNGHEGFYTIDAAEGDGDLRGAQWWKPLDEPPPGKAWFKWEPLPITKGD